MSWKSFAAQDVLNEGFNPSEVNALKTMQGADNLALIVASVIGQVRGAVIAGGNQLDQPGLIPDQLRDAAVALARWRLLVSFPQLKTLQTPERKAAHDQANATLLEVAKGGVKIELPTAPTTDPGPAGQVRLVARRPRLFTPQHLREL